jgi:hypothetical protein
MADAKHTPGPWFDWEAGVWNYEPNKLLTNLEDARLIAVAPDLLACLIDCREACLFDDDNGGVGVSEDVVISHELFDRICATIAKATTLTIQDQTQR